MLRGLLGAIIGLAVMVAAGYAAAVVYINNDGQRLAALYLQPWGRQGEVRYGAVNKPMFEDTVTISDVSVRTPDGRSFKIDRIVIRDYDWLNLRQPRHADVRIEGAETTPEGLGPRLGPTIKASGLDRLVASAHYRYRYDDETNRFVIETVRVDVADVGTLTLTARLELPRYPDMSMLRDISGIVQLGTSAKLIGAKATFRNKALVDRLLQGYAAAERIATDEARERLIDDLDKQRRRTKNPIEKDALTAAIAFIERPGEIEAEAAPRVPVSLVAATALVKFSPSELKRTLGLRIEARPPEGPTPTPPDQAPDTGPKKAR